MKLKSLIAFLLFSALTVAVKASAQNVDDDSYRYDVGLSLGLSGYLGDANNSLTKHLGFDAQLSGRYMPNSRMAFRAVFATGSLSGNTADVGSALPDDAEYSFSARFYDLSVRYEFNFFAYGIGETYKKLRRWTPYLTAGVGATLSVCDGYTSVAPSLPMGLGLKVKLRPRLNLMAEFTMTKVFGDHVDGRNIADLAGIKSSFIKNTDWVSQFTIGITYEFSRRCSTCHYVD